MEPSQSISLLEAAGLYVGTLKKDGIHQEAERELFRFVKWCGPGKSFSDITPPEIGEYGNQMAGTGTSPLVAERLQVVRGFLLYAKKKGFTERSLAQHLRIRKPKTRASKTRVQGLQESVELTADGHAQLRAELEKLKAQRGPIAVQIRKAAADKDVRENVPLEAAREQLGHVESRIRSIESTLEYAVIIGSTPRDSAQIVKLGARVFVKDLNTGRENSYTLVDRSEAQPAKGKISDVSPLGNTLVGHFPGQEVEVETPGGKTRYRILKVTS